MPLKVLVLHGPNVSLHREGGRTVETLDAQLVARAAALGAELRTCSANAEGTLLDELHRHREWVDAVIVNPSSLAPVAFGLADALALIGKPAVEVLLAHESKGRGKSALRQAVEKQFHGHGFDGYLKALEALSRRGASAAATTTPKSLGAGRAAREAKAERATAGEAAGQGRNGGKTIGKKRQSEAAAPPETSRGGKSIGRRVDPAQDGGKPASSAGSGISRSLVRARLTDRLQKKTSPEAFAGWAQGQYQALKSGAAVEAGQAQLLEETLLLLAASARLTDELLITTLAKLDS